MNFHACDRPAIGQGFVLDIIDRLVFFSDLANAGLVLVTRNHLLQLLFQLPMREVIVLEGIAGIGSAFASADTGADAFDNTAADRIDQEGPQGRIRDIGTVDDLGHEFADVRTKQGRGSTAKRAPDHAGDIGDAAEQSAGECVKRGTPNTAFGPVSTLLWRRCRLLELQRDVADRFGGLGRRILIEFLRLQLLTQDILQIRKSGKRRVGVISITTQLVDVLALVRRVGDDDLTGRDGSKRLPGGAFALAEIWGERRPEQRQAAAISVGLPLRIGVDILPFERAGLKPIVVCRCLAADDAANQRGVIADGDVEATGASMDTGLLRDNRGIAIGLLVAARETEAVRTEPAARRQLPGKPSALNTAANRWKRPRRRELP
ncbi:hypothetical protein ATY79_18555 [Rhizobium sp. R693]|nr:hypothetical protein ATY79_18555 [Rhizobium sp. R693]